MMLGKRFQQIKPVNAWLLLIIIIGAILRFYDYSGFSFSNDELSAINRLRFSTFRDLVEKGFYVDGHPGGIQVMLWYWVKIFGVSEASLRFPFVIFGILTVWFSYLTSRQFFGAVTGLFVSAAVAFLEFPLVYSQIARPYGSGIFFCMLMVWFWYRVVNGFQEKTETKKKRLLNLAGYTISTALCMYNHYFSFLLAGVVGITGIFLIKRERLTGYLAAGLIACLLFLPHVPITLNHLTYKGVGLWLGKPSPQWIFGHILFIFNEQLWFLILTVMVAATLALINRQRSGLYKYQTVSFLFFILPMVMGYLYSVAVNPVLQHPVLLFSFPFLLFLIFSCAGDNLKPIHSLLLAFFLTAGIYSTVGCGHYYRKQHFGEFKDVAARIAATGNRFGKNNVTNVVSTNCPYYISYYYAKQGDSARLSMTEVTADSLESLGRLVRNCGTPYFLYAWTKPSPPEADDIIMASFPYIIDEKDYGGLSSLKVFSVNKPEKGYTESRVIFFRQGLPEDKMRKSPDRNFHNSLPSGGAGLAVIDSTEEYGPALTVPASEIRATGQETVRAEASVYMFKTPTQAVFVTSLEVPGKEPLIWKGALVRNYADAGKWQKVVQTFLLPEKIDKSSVLKIYIWNKGKESLLVREMNLSVVANENASDD